MARPPRDPDDDIACTRDGRIDPARLDVADKPERKRKRKARNRPEPSAELRSAEPAMEKRALARPHPPGVICEPAGFDEEHWTSPHSDRDLWTLQLAEAFGTRSEAVISTFMQQLERLCGKNIWDEDAHQWRLDEHEFSAAVAMVSTVRPKNEMEAALGAQMVAVHLLAMKCSARALKYDADTRSAAVAGKLARTFNDQLRVMQELKGKTRSTRQTFAIKKEVRQYVQYNDNRGGRENCGQPQATDGGGLRHARTCEPQERPALPSPGEVNEKVVLFPGDEERAVSSSRRAKSGGTKG